MATKKKKNTPNGATASTNKPRKQHLWKNFYHNIQDSLWAQYFVKDDGQLDPYLHRVLTETLERDLRYIENRVEFTLLMALQRRNYDE